LNAYGPSGGILPVMPQAYCKTNYLVELLLQKQLEFPFPGLLFVVLFRFVPDSNNHQAQYNSIDDCYVKMMITAHLVYAGLPMKK
jgi:hypothetical protein